MEKLKFSVSMCVYGGDSPIWFREALESIYNQTRLPDEVVLQVDGPVSKEIDSVISHFQEIYGMRVYRLEKNSGHGIARRECLEHCNYDYVAIADADDINVPTRFEKQIACFEKDPTLSAVSSWCYHFTENINNILNEEKIPVTDEDIKEYIKKRCPLCQASTMFKKAKVEEVGGYVDWYCAEDYYLWVRMALQGAKFYNVPESLLYVRSDNGQSKRRGGWKYYKSMRDLFRYMRKNKMISLGGYIYNTTSRFVMQVLMPSKIRSFIRKKFL